MSVNDTPESNEIERLIPRLSKSENWPEEEYFVQPKPVDRRVRSRAGDFRVVAPDGRQKGSKFYVNNSAMVIERRSKDAMGAEKWDRVASYAKPGPVGDSTEIDLALYWLLAGPDAE